MSTLEVIALGPLDAERAQEGGADRLELVAGMAAGGLTPAPSTIRQVHAATDLPVRVMLRADATFTAGNLDGLRRAAGESLAAGASEFVFGFLTDEGEVDAEACAALEGETGGCPWTFHRAVDRAADVGIAHGELAGLGCDTVLSAGDPAGVAAGLPVLHAVAARRRRPELLVGGGLGAEHVPELRASGARSFHIGSAARAAGWSSPIDAEAVRSWAALIR